MIEGTNTVSSCNPPGIIRDLLQIQELQATYPNKYLCYKTKRGKTKMGMQVNKMLFQNKKYFLLMYP